MSRYIIRLDDACEHMNFEKWKRIEDLLVAYEVKPLVGVIPKCEDKKLRSLDFIADFWNIVKKWQVMGWQIALHGFNHVYLTNDGGINPVNKKSEFAGVPLEIQKEKIKKGLAIFKKHDIDPMVFFAPAHTFDENTLLALQSESEIRVISDTVANDVYFHHGFTFVPQQSGSVRKIPLKLVTFCYHPNTMTEKDFEKLNIFLKKHKKKFCSFPVALSTREKSLFDKYLSFLYFLRRK